MQPVLPPRDEHNRNAGRKKYVLLLMVEEPAGEAAAGTLRACQRACNDKVDDACFQRDGTRHFTLAKRIGDAAADALRRDGLGNCVFPTMLGLGPFMRWPKCAALSLSPDAKIAVQPLLSMLGGMQGRVGHVEGAEQLHMSVYRMRARGKQARDAQATEFKRAVATVNAEQGHVRATRIILKREGADYTDCVIMAE